MQTSHPEYAHNQDQAHHALRVTCLAVKSWENDLVCSRKVCGGSWEERCWSHWLSWVTVCAEHTGLFPEQTNGYRTLAKVQPLPQPLPASVPSLGYHYLQCVTSDSLGQALKQSILHNLENQPSLQKQRGNIGNKDGYII